MIEYSANFELEVIRKDLKPWQSPYTVTEQDVISEVQYFYDMIDFEADFYFEDPRFAALDEGLYFVYVRGQAEFESDRDWESGIEGGHFLLGIDTLTIKKLEDGIEDEDDSGLSV